MLSKDESTVLRGRKHCFPSKNEIPTNGDCAIHQKIVNLRPSKEQPLPKGSYNDLICDNYSLLMVMSRFGLSLGFGDRSVKDVCQAQGVDYKTFLAVANFISHEPYTYSGEEDDFSLTALMDYLKQAHTYFLDFNLPAIRRKLIPTMWPSSS